MNEIVKNVAFGFKFDIKKVFKKGPPPSPDGFGEGGWWPTAELGSWILMTLAADLDAVGGRAYLQAGG